MMLKEVPGQLGLKLTTAFELVKNAKPDSKTWFKLSSIVYFNHDTDNAESRSKLQAHILDGITVGRYDRYNSIIFYNPITSSYYPPPDFRLNESRLLITNFPNYLRFDGDLTCGLLRDKPDSIHKPFPPGIRMYIQYYNAPACRTIKKIPNPVSSILTCLASPSTEQSDNDSISSETQESPPYVILLDYGTTVKK